MFSRINHNQPYHILSRAVDKKEIFGKNEDCFRFIFQMYAANIGKPMPNLHRKDVIKVAQALLFGEEIPPGFFVEEHPPLVYFLSFSLISNHYHFNLISNTEKGIPLYMQRLNIGFAKYFNLKHERTGTLFESRYKSIPIQTDFQLEAILRYINVINPLDVYQPGWRKKGLAGQHEALNFLNKYQFSSFPDLFGKRNSKILAPREIIEKFLGEEITKNQQEYLSFIKDFLEKESSFFNTLFLE